MDNYFFFCIFSEFTAQVIIGENLWYFSCFNDAPSKLPGGEKLTWGQFNQRCRSICTYILKLSTKWSSSYSTWTYWLSIWKTTPSKRHRHKPLWGGKQQCIAVCGHPAHLSSEFKWVEGRLKMSCRRCKESWDQVLINCTVLSSKATWGLIS